MNRVNECADTVHFESESYKFSPDCFLCSLAHTVHLAHVITEKAALQGAFLAKRKRNQRLKIHKNVVQTWCKKPGACRKRYENQRISDQVKVLQNPQSPVQIWVSPPEINLVIVVKTTITRFIAFSDPFALPWG